MTLAERMRREREPEVDQNRNGPRIWAERALGEIYGLIARGDTEPLEGAPDPRFWMVRVALPWVSGWRLEQKPVQVQALTHLLHGDGWHHVLASQAPAMFPKLELGVLRDPVVVETLDGERFEIPFAPRASVDEVAEEIARVGCWRYEPFAKVFIPAHRIRAVRVSLHARPPEGAPPLA